MSNFLDLLFRSQPASGLLTNTGSIVDVAGATPPVAGYVLQAVDDLHAIWVPATGVDATARAAAAAALAAAGVAAKTWQGNVGSTPLWVTPADRGLTPDARNDEFDSTTLDPAWQFWDSVNNVNRTPTLGLNFTTAFPSGTTTPPRYAVHTSGAEARASWLRMQVQDSAGTCYMTKPATLAVGEWVSARVNMGRFPGESSNSDGTFTTLILMGTTSGLPSLTKRIGVASSRTTAGTLCTFSSVDTGGGGSQNSSANSGSVALGQPTEYMAIFRASSTKYVAFLFNDAGQSMALGSLSGIAGAGTGVVNVATLDRVGLGVSTATGNAPLTYVPHAGMDFIRFSTTCPF